MVANWLACVGKNVPLTRRYAKVQSRLFKYMGNRSAHAEVHRTLTSQNASWIKRSANAEVHESVGIADCDFLST